MTATMQRVFWATMALLLCSHAATSSARAPDDAPPHPTCQSTWIAARSMDQTLDAADETTQIDGAGLKTPVALLAAAKARTAYTVAVINGGDFSGWDFSGAVLENLCFNGSLLSDSKWRAAKLSGIGFHDSILQRADFAGAAMREVLLVDSDAAAATAVGADWTGGRIAGGWGGDLTGLDLTRANLTGFAFQCGITIDDGCPLDREGILLTGANLTRAELSGFSMWGAVMAGARIDDTVVAPRQLATLRGADVRGDVLVGNIILTTADWAALQPYLVAAPTPVDAPSFDCARAKAPLERTICAPDFGYLRTQDRELAALYARARKLDPAVGAAQAAWAKARASCYAPAVEDSAACLSQRYAARRGALLAALGAPADLANQPQIYVDW
ncbi:MAG: hypothetical protein RLZZ58_1485, partial [Pseudomonadota bacterium]